MVEGFGRTTSFGGLTITYQFYPAVIKATLNYTIS